MKKPLATWRGLNCEREPWALASSLVPASATLNQPRELSGSQSPQPRGGRLDSRCVQSPDQPWGLPEVLTREQGAGCTPTAHGFSAGSAASRGTPRAPSPSAFKGRAVCRRLPAFLTPQPCRFRSWTGSDVHLLLPARLSRQETKTSSQGGVIQAECPETLFLQSFLISEWSAGANQLHNH